MRFSDHPVSPQRLVVSVREAEDISGLSHTTIHEKIKTGELASTKIRRRRVIDRASLVKLLTGNAA